MARASTTKQVKSKAPAKTEKNEKTIEEIEEDLQLPESSEEEEEDQEELSEESEDDDEEVEGLSDEDDDEEEEDEEKDEEEDEKIIEKLATTTGHKVNRVITKDQTSGSATANKKSKRGIIYIGRLPEGFQEEELTKYFEQFGKIINLKLSRNKKTGKSKHYGFIEFENVDVAKIAAETMNNYLLFGHLLKCEVIIDNEKELFNGSEKKFKVIPWQKISKHKNDKPKSNKQWTKLVEKFEHQKVQKQKELNDKGIDFDLNSI
ncbi:hypothetical protein DFJ63DRAFT_214294 [Scheffersomyces coipomensis]|uniref:uncharacterized protein n=1 Tax=Scheffersomyces coipomensis TaxID=1788519 RepID=UPI00315DD389